MFETIQKKKEVDIQMQLMENRLKRLKDEEDRAVKKIQDTIQRTQNYEKLKEQKDMEK